MKNLLCICFLFILESSFSQASLSGIVHYETKINKKQLTEYLKKGRNKLKNDRVKGTLDNIYQNTSSITSSLTFVNNTGTFKVDEQLNLDTKELAQTVLKTVSGGSNEYYYNTTNHVFLIKECQTLGECFIYDNTYLEWTLTQETKRINNFLCYKATRNKDKVIAWYTPKIPFGFGPKGEYGLPGLILELEIGRIIFKATKIVINPKEKITVKAPKDGKRVSKKEYEDILKKSTKNFFDNN